LLGVIGAIVATFWLQILWPICFLKFRRLSKFVFCGYFLTSTIVNFVFTFDVGTLNINSNYNENFVQLTVVYIVLMNFFTYCEFTLSLFFYSPIYVISCFLVSAAQRDEIALVAEQLSEETRYMVQDST